jgi:hypothetical protein
VIALEALKRKTPAGQPEVEQKKGEASKSISRKTSLTLDYLAE